MGLSRCDETPTDVSEHRNPAEAVHSWREGERGTGLSLSRPAFALKRPSPNKL